MAYYNDGKTFRNLPEQVDKNKTDIEEMQSTVEADEKNINDNMNKILAHDTRINALETTKLSASDSSIKLTRSNAEMGSVSIAKVGGNTLVNGNDIPLATINGESIMQNKDFTIDSNLSDLLWANLGIGRWANHTLTPLESYGSFDNHWIDALSNQYTSLIQYGEGTIWKASNKEELYNGTIILPNFNTRNAGVDCQQMFAHLDGVKTLVFGEGVFLNPFYMFAFSTVKKIAVKDGTNPKFLATRSDGFYFFNCPNLEEIGSIDFSGINVQYGDIYANYIFKGCSKLKKISIKHWKYSFNISMSTAFENADLVEILNNLDVVSTTETLTMGATNLAKLSSSDILIATGKGWQLA